MVLVLRALIWLSLACSAWTDIGHAAAIAYPDVLPGRKLEFPADHGSHADFRTEWWYITGWLRPAGTSADSARAIGFQVTFFRSRLNLDDRNPSAFAPRQLIFAHAAISDPALGKLRHDQRLARAGFEIAQAAAGDADVRIDRWHLRRDPASGAFLARIEANGFSLDLQFDPRQPELPQGSDENTLGYSRKGPDPRQASWYYSLPHLAARGTVTRDGKPQAVVGEAWLDHEWSTAYLDPRAAGWDWTGINFDDGSVLMAFRIRAKAGAAAKPEKTLWAGGAFRRPDGAVERYAPDEIRFTPLRTWASPRTGIEYPVELRLTVEHAGVRRGWRLSPLMDDQELDSRASTGTIYWEGAVRTVGEGAAGPAGRGYLELTGYDQPLKF